MEEDYDPKLTALCNSKTIQEDARGFFDSLVENITTNTRIREWSEDMWKEPIYGEDFIKALMKQDDIFTTVLETFSVEEVYRKKCVLTACKKLAEAEELWKAEQWQRCRDSCSQSILRVPLKSASPHELPKNMTHVLQGALLLRARCLLKEGKTQLAKTDISTALQQGPLIDASKKYLLEVLKELKSHSLEENKPVELSADECTGMDTHLSVGEDKKLPGASILLNVSETTEQGRFISAAKDIKIGDTLIIEQPYAACLNPQFFGTHCHHCFKRLEAPYGCSECAAVAFCGENCYQEAVSTYHQYECKFMDLFIGSGMSSLSHIALRMITQIGLTETINVYQKYSQQHKNNKSASQNGEEQIDTSPHGVVYKLVTHEQRRLPQDYVHRSLMALFLTRCLQKTSFFSNAVSEGQNLNILGPQEVSVWAVLLFYLQVLQYNAHQVCGLRGEKDLGCALYTTASLFNHDCCPSVIRYFLGKKLVIKALRPVSSGEAVGDSYGPQWGRSTGKGDEWKRRTALCSRYKFTCKCHACSQEWPLPPSELPNLRCQYEKCNGCLDENCQCNTCGKTVGTNYMENQQDALMKSLGKIKDGLAINDRRERGPALEAALMEYGQLTHQPCPITLKAEDALRSYYAVQLDQANKLTTN